MKPYHLKEACLYTDNIKMRFGNFNYAPNGTVFEPRNHQEHLNYMIAGISSPVKSLKHDERASDEEREMLMNPAEIQIPNIHNSSASSKSPSESSEDEDTPSEDDEDQSEHDNAVSPPTKKRRMLSTCNRIIRTMKRNLEKNITKTIKEMEKENDALKKRVEKLEATEADNVILKNTIEEMKAEIIDLKENKRKKTCLECGGVVSMVVYCGDDCHEKHFQ